MGLLIRVIIIIFFFAIPLTGWAANHSTGTYYVTQTVQGDGSGSSYVNSMSVATHNADTFDAPSTIYLCDTINSPVVARSSGSSGSLITYRGDYSGHSGVLSNGIFPNPATWTDAGGGIYTLTTINTRTVWEDGVPIKRATDNTLADGYWFHSNPAGSGTLYWKSIQGSGTPSTRKITYAQSVAWTPTHQIGILLNGRSYITVDGVTFMANSIGVAGYAESYSNVTVKNCTFQYNVNDILFGNIVSTSAGLITNNTSYRAGRSIAIYGIEHTGWTISNNSLRECGTINGTGTWYTNTNQVDLEAIGIQGFINSTIEHNTISGKGFCVGIFLYAHSVDHGGGTGVRGNTVRYNRVADTTYQGMYFAGDDGSVIENNNVYYNIISGCGTDPTRKFAILLRPVSGTSVYNNFYNNTVFGGIILLSFDGRQNAQYWNIKNNIFGSMANTGRAVSFIAAAPTQVNIDYNIYYPNNSTASANMFMFPYLTLRDFDRWKEAGFDTHSSFADPLLLSTSNYSLQHESPAIDKGTPVGLIADYTGAVVPYGTLPDIGAYECMTEVRELLAPLPPLNLQVK